MLAGKGKPEKREDALLDTISALVKRRESCLIQIELWEVADPSLHEILDDIRHHLLGNEA